MRGVPPAERGAAFICALVYLRHANDPVPLICQGTWRGLLLDAPRGDNGFGYDPLFLVPELDRTSAELPPQEKNRRSHRGQALSRFLLDAIVSKYAKDHLEAHGRREGVSREGVTVDE